MEISIRHIGRSPVKPLNIIEMIVSDCIGDVTIKETITDLNGNVDENLISELRNIADELEAQNRLGE